MDAFSLIATLELQAEGFFSGLSSAADAMIQFAEECVQTGMEFDDSMARVKAVSLSAGTITDSQIKSLTETARKMGYEFVQGANNTETAFNALRAAALATGATTMFTANESAEALFYMGMAGWDAEQMLQGLPGIIDLAAISGVNLGRTSDIVTDALTAFKMEAKDATYFSNLLAVASANANTNVDLMGETFKYVAPIAGAYGYAAEDVALAIGLMANSGIKASQAGTNLRNIMTRLATNAGQRTDSVGNIITPGALDILTGELGVDFYDDMGNIRDFSDLIMDIREAWKDLTPEEATNYSKQMAGMYGLSGFLALMNASEESVLALQEALAGCWYTMDSFSEAVANSGGNLETMKSNMQGLGITTEEFNSALNNSRGNATAFMDELLKAANAGTTMEDIAGALGMSLEQLAQAFANTTGAARGMADIIMDTLKGDVTYFDSALDGLKITIADKLTPTIREYVQLATDGIQRVQHALQYQGIDAAASEFANWIQAAGAKLEADLPIFEEKATKVINAISSALNDPKTQNAISSALTTIGNLIGKFLSDNAATITTTVTSFITGLTPGIVAAVKGIGNGLREAWPEIKAGIGEMFQEWGLFKEGTFAGMIPQWIKDAAGMFGWDLTGTANQAQKELETYLLGGNKSGTPNGQPTYDLTQKGVGNQLAEKAGKPETVLDTAAQAAQDSGLSNIIEGIQNGSIIQTLVGAGETGIAALGSFLFGTKDKNKAAQAERQNQLNATLTGNAANYDPNKTYDFSDWQWTSDEGVTITANFVDNVSENAKSAIDALTDLGNLVSDDYDTTSLHTDLTSPAAKQAVHSILELLGYDGLEQFTSSYHENGASGPIEEAFMDLLTLMGYDGHEFLTSSAHDSAQAAAAILEILALITQNEAKDGSVTTTTNRQINETVNITYTQDGGKLPPLNGGGNADPNMNVLNAIAMSPGRILRGATMFGWDAFGNPQIGGEVGAEAVVGVNSLDQMIQNSVNAAMSAVLGRLDALISGRSDRPLKVVLDTGALVGGIVDAMDSEMDTIAQWKAGDRA